MSTEPTAPEPWYYRGLELYARIGLWVGGIVFSLFLLLTILAVVNQLFQAIAAPAGVAHGPNREILLASEGPLDGLFLLGQAQAAPAHRAGVGPSLAGVIGSMAWVVVLLGLSLFGLLTFLLPSKFILLAVDAARTLRAIRRSVEGRALA